MGHRMSWKVAGTSPADLFVWLRALLGHQLLDASSGLVTNSCTGNQSESVKYLNLFKSSKTRALMS